MRDASTRAALRNRLTVLDPYLADKLSSADDDTLARVISCITIGRQWYDWMVDLELQTSDLEERIAALTSERDALSARLAYIASRYVGGDFASELYPESVILHLALPREASISADFIATLDRAISAHPPEASA